MGERLCVNIIREDTTIAVAYYHWSAYSVPAFEELQSLVNTFENSIAFASQDIDLMSDDEIIYGLAHELTGVNNVDADRKAYTDLCHRLGVGDPDPKIFDGNRTYGILCLPHALGGTEDDGADGLAEVNLDDKTVGNSCFWLYEDKQELLDYFKENYDDGDYPEVVKVPSPANIAWDDLSSVTKDYEALERTDSFLDPGDCYLEMIRG